MLPSIFIYSRCVTCALPYTSCPGHIGHIELAMPMYNPTVFTNLFKLMRCMCFVCHKFRMSDARVQRYVDLLTLLQAGKLVEASKLADANHGKGLMPGSGNKKGEEDALDLELKDSRALYMEELLGAVEEARKQVAAGNTG